MFHDYELDPDEYKAAQAERLARRIANILLAIVILVFAALAVVVWSTGFALAHDALPTAAQPNGWKYPYVCCSGIDCREVDASTIKEGPNGYTVPSGEVIEMSSKKIKDSPDGAYHWCTVGGKPDGKTICLFVPPRSF